MFDLVFSDSVKAALAETGKRAEHIESLWLELDVGSLKRLSDIECRKDVVFSILEGPEGIRDAASENEVWKSNLRAVKRVTESDSRGEDVRIWWSDSPAETCGFYFAAGLLENAGVRVTSVKLPPYFEEGENICMHDSLKSLEPKKLVELLPLEREVSHALRRAASRRWSELVSEDAPLRAVVNGRLVSAPIDFYDYTLRRHFPGGEFTVAYAIGKTLGENQLGISDWWYAQRIRRMIERGELEVAKPDKNFYMTRIRKTPQAE